VVFLLVFFGFCLRLGLEVFWVWDAPQYGVYGAARTGGGTEVQFPEGTPWFSVTLGGFLSD
jgi:hypothetical protein